MQKSRWVEIIGTIHDSFTVLSEGQVPRETGEPGQIEFIEFQGPLGHIRCEYEWHPKIIGKRAIGGHKVGAGARVKYEYDPHEQTGELTVFRRVNNDWQEIDAGMFQ